MAEDADWGRQLAENVRRSEELFRRVTAMSITEASRDGTVRVTVPDPTAAEQKALLPWSHRAAGGQCILGEGAHPAPPTPTCAARRTGQAECAEHRVSQGARPEGHDRLPVTAEPACGDDGGHRHDRGPPARDPGQH
jgi:hypothetical protein